MTDATNQQHLEAAVIEQPVDEKSAEVKITSAQVQPAATATPKKPAAKKRPRMSREEQIQQQANPATRLAGQQKTILLPFSYQSDIMHEYIQLNQSKMLDAYERLAALLRMISTTPVIYQEVKDWIGKNTQIADAQLSELTSQRLSILEQAEDVEFPTINVPATYETKFEASHPIANMMLATLRRVDTELAECEKLYLALLIDDLQYRQLFTQATNVIRGSVDRIFKATTPGRRKDNGRYSPAQLSAWLREGNKLMFNDVPSNLSYIIEDAA